MMSRKLFSYITNTKYYEIIKCLYDDPKEFVVGDIVILETHITEEGKVHFVLTNKMSKQKDGRTYFPTLKTNELVKSFSENHLVKEKKGYF